MFLLPGLREEAEVSGRTQVHLFLRDVQVVSITIVQGQAPGNEKGQTVSLIQSASPSLESEDCSPQACRHLWIRSLHGGARVS